MHWNELVLSLLTQIVALTVPGGLVYQGTWNASTNTPTLASGTGTKGDYYVVSVAGSTDLDGITDWQPGDWATFNGTAWQKVDNTENPKVLSGQIESGSAAVAATTSYYEATATGTATLPAAPELWRRIYFKRNYAGASAYTIAGNGKNIGGVANVDLTFDGQSIALVYNGTQWTVN